MKHYSMYIVWPPKLISIVFLLLVCKPKEVILIQSPFLTPCRAEVGLLTHNVVIEGTRLGDPAGFNGIGADQYGSQVFIHRSGMADLPVRLAI